MESTKAATTEAAVARRQVVEVIASALQKGCHAAVEAMVQQQPSVSCQDATNTWLFYHLAEVVMRVRELESRVATS